MLPGARRWLRKLKRPAVSLERQTPRPTPGQREAAQALQRAECARDLAAARACEVAEEAERLRQLRNRNHFAEAIRLSMGGHA